MKTSSSHIRMDAHASGAGRIRASALGFACVLLAACTSTPEPAALPDSQAARLAERLETAARAGDPRLEAAQEEMDALEAALTGRPEPVTAAPEPEPAALPPAPETGDMRSVFHAVHIASYRSLELAERGWAIYSRHPELSEREAVAEEVELAESGRWYRLKAGPYDTRGAAVAACAAFEARGDWCRVTDFNGTPIAP